MKVFTSPQSANATAARRADYIAYRDGKRCRWMTKKTIQHMPDRSRQQGWKVLFWVNDSFVGCL